MTHADAILDEPDGSTPRDVYRLGAMEIWGGNQARDDRVVVPGLDAAIYASPFQGGREGGDLHFLSTCAAGQISRFTIADVAGHGVEAGAFSARLRSLIRKHINTPNPTRFTRALNEEFASMSLAGLFATAVIITYFAPSDHLIVCNAGHPRPLLFRERSGRWTLLDENSEGLVTPDHARDTGVGNLPLGLLEGTTYPQFATRLEAGDIIVAYTDALIESSDGSGDQLGERGLLSLVSSLDRSSPASLRQEILDAVSRYRGNAPSNDDQTLLVVCHTGEDPPPASLSVRLRTLGRLVGLVPPGVGEGFGRASA